MAMTKLKAKAASWMQAACNENRKAPIELCATGEMNGSLGMVKVNMACEKTAQLKNCERSVKAYLCAGRPS